MSKTKNDTVTNNEIVHTIESVMSDESTSKSYKIRTLASLGLNTSNITKTMKTKYPQFLYQHARNVLNQKLKKST